MIATRTFAATRVPSSWQISLRSLLVLTVIAAMVLAWWREFGERFGDLVTNRWITVATIALPLVVASWELRLRRFLPELLKLSVVLAAFNTVWGFFSSLAVLPCCNCNTGEDLAEFVASLEASLVWSFLLPTALVLVASLLAFTEKSSRVVRLLANISTIVVNVLLIYWGVTFLLETDIDGFDRWRSSLYEFFLRFDSHP